MSQTVYDQHDKAFDQVSAYVIMRGKERAATIAFKSPRDGAGRLNVFCHWIGLPMVKGYAGGYGYDKRTAALANAAQRVELDPEHQTPAQLKAQKRFIKCLSLDNGYDWATQLREHGFTVLQAV